MLTNSLITLEDVRASGIYRAGLYRAKIYLTPSDSINLLDISELPESLHRLDCRDAIQLSGARFAAQRYLSTMPNRF